MPVIRSTREELEELGIATDGTPDVRLAIRDFLYHPSLTPEVRARLVLAFLALQNQYLNKNIRRKVEPTRIGRVQHIRPLRNGDFRCPVVINDDVMPASQFEAYIKWQGKRAGCYQRLDQIEPVP